MNPKSRYYMSCKIIHKTLQLKTRHTTLIWTAFYKKRDSYSNGACKLTCLRLRQPSPGVGWAGTTNGIGYVPDRGPRRFDNPVRGPLRFSPNPFSIVDSRMLAVRKGTPGLPWVSMSTPSASLQSACGTFEVVWAKGASNQLILRTPRSVIFFGKAVFMLCFRGVTILSIPSKWLAFLKPVQVPKK